MQAEGTRPWPEKNKLSLKRSPIARRGKKGMCEYVWRLAVKLTGSSGAASFPATEPQATARRPEKSEKPPKELYCLWLVQFTDYLVVNVHFAWKIYTCIRGSHA